MVGRKKKNYSGESLCFKQAYLLNETQFLWRNGMHAKIYYDHRATFWGQAGAARHGATGQHLHQKNSNKLFLFYRITTRDTTEICT